MNPMTHGTNDLAPLSDFVVTQTIIKRTRRKVYYPDWLENLTMPIFINYDTKTFNLYAIEPDDIEICLDDAMVANGWSIVWVTP